MSEFSDWEELRAELHDGGDAALEAERERTKTWTHAFVPREEVLAAFATAPMLDAERFRADIDTIADQDSCPPTSS